MSKETKTPWSARVNAKVFRKALRLMMFVVETRTTIPVLSTIRLRVVDDKLTLVATDLDFELAVDVEAETDGVGCILISPRFLDGLASISDSTVTISHPGSGDIIAVEAWEAKAKYRCIIPVDDFPVMTGFAPGQEVMTSTGQMRAPLKHVMGCISTEVTRYYLNGVYFHPSRDRGGETLAMVATDGHRLAKYETALKWKDQDGIIPSKAVNLFMSLLPANGNGEVRLGMNRDRVRFHLFGDGFRLSGKMIDGTFPDYQRVIPREGTGRIKADLTATALRRMARLTKAGDDQHGSRAVKIAPSEGVMIYRGGIPDYAGGLTEVSLPVTGEGDPIGFNAKYLADICAGFDVIRMEAADSGAPGRFFTEDPNLTKVLMPMRV
ncbi:DNA polymerase III subunit beta [Salipiger sp.]|uniref:DNA polymerase III subunit beta n=1 Tax=Salipiger sp. TaxID=2078585 RepID=UPI003A971E2C